MLTQQQAMVGGLYKLFLPVFQSPLAVASLQFCSTGLLMCRYSNKAGKKGVLRSY